MSAPHPPSDRVGRTLDAIETLMDALPQAERSFVRTRLIARLGGRRASLTTAIVVFLRSCAHAGEPRVNLERIRAHLASSDWPPIDDRSLYQAVADLKRRGRIVSRGYGRYAIAPVGAR